MNNKIIVLAIVALAMVGVVAYNTAKAECIKAITCTDSGNSCHWYETCVLAPTSVAVLTDCPDPLGYEPGGAVCGRCFGLFGWGNLCGPGSAVAACI